MTAPPKRALAKADFAALSEFRYQMRRFERFSENAVQAEGITPLQYLLLLHIKGYKGRDWATVGELAERLQAKPHGVVALISRCEAGAAGRAAPERERPPPRRDPPAAGRRNHPDPPGRTAPHRAAFARRHLRRAQT